MAAVGWGRGGGAHRDQRVALTGVGARHHVGGEGRGGEEREVSAEVPVSQEGRAGQGSGRGSADVPTVLREAGVEGLAVSQRQ